MGEPDDHLAGLAAGVRSTMEGLKGELRGQPVNVAEQRLVDALRAKDIFLPRGTLRTFAVQLADPWWSLKHPLRARRQFREWARQADPESTAAETEADEVAARIERIVDAEGSSPALTEWSFRAQRTFDGMRYELELHPFSAVLADRVRRELDPIPIRILGPDSPT